MNADELRTLLRSSLGSDKRKRWLFYIASLQSLLIALPEGPVAEVVKVGVEFADWWASADLEDVGLDERTQLIRSYDRRQLRIPILQRLEGVRLSEFPGTPTTRRQVEFFALQAAVGLLYDTHEWGWDPEYTLSSAWAALDDPKQPKGVSRRPSGTGGSQARERQLELARDIFGNPFRPVAFSPAWRTDTAVSLARAMYAARDFSAMPILADALQDAGCDSADILDHCRNTAQVHVRGCWVVDLVLGKS